MGRFSQISILFLPVKKSGLVLPTLVGLYKKQQATRMVQLFRSKAPGVRKAADLRLIEEERETKDEVQTCSLG